MTPHQGGHCSLMLFLVTYYPPGPGSLKGFFSRHTSSARDLASYIASRTTERKGEVYHTNCVFVEAHFVGNNPWLIVDNRMVLSYWQDLSWTSIKATKLSGAQLRERREGSPSKRSSTPSSVSSKARPSPEPPWRRKTPKTLLPKPLMQVWSLTHLLWFRVFLSQSTIPRDWYPLWNTLFWCDTHATAKNVNYCSF